MHRRLGDSGTRDFLKILLDAAASGGRDVSSIKRALVSGAAFPKSLQDDVKSHGIDAYQAFGTADLGLVAFETPARQGMVVNEDLIMEIGALRHRRSRHAATSAKSSLRSIPAPRHGLALTALPGASPCGRTNTPIQGLDGPRRSDHQGQGQRPAPSRSAEIGKRHPKLAACALSSRGPARAI